MAASSLPNLAVRPLVPVAIVFAVGVLLGEGLTGPVAVAVGAVGAGGMALWTRRAFWLTAALLLAFAAVGGWRACLFARPVGDDVARFVGPGFFTVRGTVASDVDVSPYTLSCQMEARQIVTPDGQRYACAGRVAMRLRRSTETAPLDYGDTLEARGRLERPEEARNPSGFGYADYLRRQRIFAVLITHRAGDWRALPASIVPTDWIPRAALQWRASLQRTLDALLPPLESNLLVGIMLGRHTQLPHTLSDDFSVTSTAHVLASSGMNVAMVAALMALLCRLCRIARKPAALLTLAALAFYTLIAGAKPSILRADLMATIFLCGYLLDREADGPNALAAAALLLLAYDPGYLFDAGFQLSFVIVACIFAAMPFFERAADSIRRMELPMPARPANLLRGTLRFAAATLALTLAAQIGAAPLIAHYFNQVSLVGLAANLFIVPPLALLMGAGFAAWLCALVWPGGASSIAAYLLSPLLAYVIGAARACASLPGAVVSVPSPGWLFIAGYYAALSVILWRLQTNRKGEGEQGRRGRGFPFSLSPLLPLCLSLLALWLWRAASAPPPRLTVTFLDVGQGDSIVVQTPGGHVLVVDTGRRTPEDDLGRRVVLPFLRAQGINRVDALLLTHPDEDHVGGAATLLERMAVGRLLVSGVSSAMPAYRQAFDTAQRHGVPWVTLARGQTLDFHDGVTAETLNPPPGGAAALNHPENNGSLVVRVRYGATALLLTGDVEAEAEEEMLRAGMDVGAEVLKLGHHGSLTSSSERFLDAVHPQAAIVSAGARNVYGHPHPDVLARLAARHIRVFRTDRDGAITVVSDGRALSLRAMRRASALPTPDGHRGPSLP